MKMMIKLLIPVMGIAVASPALAGTLTVDCNRGGNDHEGAGESQTFRYDSGHGDL